MAHKLIVALALATSTAAAILPQPTYAVLGIKKPGGFVGNLLENPGDALTRLERKREEKFRQVGLTKKNVETALAIAKHIEEVTRDLRRKLGITRENAIRASVFAAGSLAGGPEMGSAAVSLREMLKNGTAPPPDGRQQSEAELLAKAIDEILGKESIESLQAMRDSFDMELGLREANRPIGDNQVRGAMTGMSTEEMRLWLSRSKAELGRRGNR